jgi:hypothetical protein
MVNVTDCSYVYVRLRPLKFRLRHLDIPPASEPLILFAIFLFEF